ncbi:uncharacterized protein LOC105850306 isoform X3 [Hydra vulgaris]|uniref:Uncharacterized protein LOC105850306 isoform X3 n=1 Tax=Hydra vulgaris TaxID=6087 RepID=A0ABM4DGA9_HYDVU
MYFLWIIILIEITMGRCQYNNTSIIERTSNEIKCPVQTLIKIESATFSPILSNCPYCQNKNFKNCSQNITEMVQNVCDGKANCVVQSTTDLYGDPCTGFTKYANIFYLCKPEGAWSSWGNWSVCSAAYGFGLINRSRDCNMSYNALPWCSGNKNEVKDCFVNITNAALIIEWSSKEIICPVQTLIKIEDATFSPVLTNCAYCQNKNVKNCSQNITGIIQKKCDRNNYCVIQSNVDLYGDPCLGFTKYTNVLYFCFSEDFSEELWNVSNIVKLNGAKVACFFSSDESSLWSELDLRIGSVLGHHSITKELYAIHRNQKTFMMFHNIHKRWLSLTNQQFYESASNYIDPTMRKSFEAEYDQTYILGPNQWLGNAQGLFSRKSNNEPWVPRIKWHF